LTIEEGGAGDYFISFSLSFISTVGNILVTAAIHGADEELYDMKSSVTPIDNIHMMTLASQGMVTLDVDDYIDLRFKCSATANLSFYQIALSMNRIYADV